MELKKNMGLFTREEKMNMESGEFETTRPGLKERIFGRTPVSDKILVQAKQQKKENKLKRKQELRDAFEKAKYEAQLSRMKCEGHKVGSMSMSDRFNNLAGGFSMSHSVRNNFNPFGSLFDSGLGKPPSRPKHKKSGGGTKYVIRGGKAYPVVGGKGKKKKSKKRVSNVGMPGFDMMDNWGFMK